MANGDGPKVYAGVDPGGTTGVVVASYQAEEGLTVLYRGSHSHPDQVLVPLKNHKPRVTIIEIPAERSAGANLGYRVYVRLVESLPEIGTVHSFRPGEWKPVAKAQQWKKPRGWNRHEWDALNLVRFYLWQRSALIHDMFKALLKGT